MPYDRVHRYFLRLMISHGVLSAETAGNKLAATFGSNISVHTVVKEINYEIRPFKQMIKITNDEMTNEEVIIFLSLGYDDATKSQGVFTANELEFFRLTIEEIMSTDARQINGIHALNLVGKMKAMFTKTDAQKMLSKWCQMRYLDKLNDNYVLGVRAIHEFDGYFRENLPDTIEECCLCKQIVYRGYNCPSCAKAVHTRCLNKYLEKVEKWPCCKIDFSRSQLELLESRSPENSRLVQTQSSDEEEAIEENTASEPTQQSTQDIDLTQEVIPEISQRIKKKRKQRSD